MLCPTVRTNADGLMEGPTADKCEKGGRPMADSSFRYRPSTLTVLLIDSHKEDREYWAQRLSIASPASVVLEADTGQTGLAICLSQHVDCVVTELTLPDMSGFQVLIKLVTRPLYPQRAVIFLSNTLLLPMARLATNNGAQAYLVKSHISGEHLDFVIRKAVNAVSLKQKDLGRPTASPATKLLPGQDKPSPITRS